MVARRLCITCNEIVKEVLFMFVFCVCLCMRL